MGELVAHRRPQEPGLLLRTAPEHMPETAHAATHRHTGKTAAYSRFPNSAHRVNGRIGALQFRLREILFRAALPGLFAEFSRPCLPIVRRSVLPVSPPRSLPNI